MQYQVIEAKGAETLAELVNDALAMGWRPQGGVSVTMWADSYQGHTKYTQAMIKESE